jgi:hypothetical protein
LPLLLKFIQQRKEARNSNAIPLQQAGKEAGNSNAIPLQQAGKEAGNSNVDPLIVLTPSVLLRPPTPALGASSAAPKKKKEPKKGSWDQKKKEMVFAELIQQNVANAEHGKAGPLMDTVVLNLANNPLFKYHPKNLLTVPNVLQMVCKEVKRVEMGVIDPARNAHSAEDWTELDNRVSKYAEAKRDKKEKRAAQRDKDAQLQEKLMFFEDNLGFGTEDKDDDMPDLADEEGTDDMPDLMEQPDGSSGGGSSLSFYNGWAPRHLGFSTTSPASSAEHPGDRQGDRHAARSLQAAARGRGKRQAPSPPSYLRLRKEEEGTGQRAAGGRGRQRPQRCDVHGNASRQGPPRGARDCA